MHCGEKLIRSRAKKEYKIPKPKVLSDGSYYARWMKDGVRYPIRGRTEAEYNANAIALIEGVIELSKPDNRKVRDLVSSYIAAREGIVSPSTIDGYERKAKNNLQSIMDLKVKDLTPARMQTAVDKDKQTYSGKTIHEAVSLVQSATGLTFPDIVKPSKKPKKKPPVYSSDDIRKLILALADIGGEVEVAGLLAAWLSLRRSEIKGLRWANVHPGFLEVVNARVYDKQHRLVDKETKNDTSTRRLSLDPYIQSRLDALPRSGDYVISMSTAGLWKGITRACEDAGIEHGYLHGLRHTNASIMALLKIDDVYANKRGGWAKSHVRQTVYTDAMTEGEAAAAEQVDSYMLGLILYGPPLPPGFIPQR